MHRTALDQTLEIGVRYADVRVRVENDVQARHHPRLGSGGSLVKGTSSLTGGELRSSHSASAAKMLPITRTSELRLGRRVTPLVSPKSNSVKADPPSRSRSAKN